MQNESCFEEKKDENCNFILETSQQNVLKAASQTFNQNFADVQHIQTAEADLVVANDQAFEDCDDNDTITVQSDVEEPLDENAAVGTDNMPTTGCVS
jgi:hypothetical protein